jgi:hypothetical protein
MAHLPDLFDKYKNVLTADTVWTTANREALHPMKLDPELEAFFIAVSLQHGTPLMPVWGVDRARLASVLTDFIEAHPGKPAALERVRQNYIELGGNQKFLETKNWFFFKIADAYLDWLYDQPESLRLRAEAMQSSDEVLRQQRAREDHRGWRGWRF